MAFKKTKQKNINFPGSSAAAELISLPGLSLFLIFLSGSSVVIEITMEKEKSRFADRRMIVHYF